MNPFSSSARHPSSQSVSGTAPVMAKTCRIRASRCLPSAVAPRHALEVLVAFEADDLRARAQRDGRILLDAANEIARHRLGESLAANEHVHVSRVSARGTPRPVRPSSRRRPRSPRRRGRAAIRRRSRRSRCPFPRTATDSAARAAGIAAPVARMIDRARTHAPSSVSIGTAAATQLSRLARRAMSSCAPNFCAWVNARAARSWPEMPVGNPR